MSRYRLSESSNQTHSQNVFLYQQLNEKRPKWNCLVCGARAYFCDLRIDKFFDKILSSNKLSPDATSVVIDKAGNWEEDKKHRGDL